MIFITKLAGVEDLMGKNLYCSRPGNHSKANISELTIRFLSKPVIVTARGNRVRD